MISTLTGINCILKGKPKDSVHQFTVKNWKGDSVSLSSFRGKKLLIVNTASYCGFTPQFKELQKLHEKYSVKNLIVLAFPSNDFAGQEPGSQEEIYSYCKSHYDIGFDLMEKVHVKGKNIHPLYQWLTQKRLNGVFSSKVLWNFQKYLIDEHGHLQHVLLPWTKPLSYKITKWLEG